MALASLRALFNRYKYSHVVFAFAAGAGLELFMNLFHVGEINFYRTLNKNMTQSAAQNKFDLQRMFLESILEEKDPPKKN